MDPDQVGVRRRGRSLDQATLLVFGLIFLVALVNLMGWYRPSMVLVDRYALAEWIALAILMAFPAAELFRRRSIYTFALCAAALLLFLGNFARHVGLLSQESSGLQGYLIQYLTPGTCIHQQDGHTVACFLLSLVMYRPLVIDAYLIVVTAGLAMIGWRAVRRT
jgi:hypothetical protein